jgi:predicted regulator of Ras-like GTPase activity (Roadblock/LC7/MglB family)
LLELLIQSDAATALIIDKGGFLITKQGAGEQLDVTTLAALAAAAFSATETIANLVNEPNFSSVYQQGDNHSMLVVNVDQHSLLVVVFLSHVSVGAVKYFARPTIEKIAHQMELAHHRNPEGGLDLSVLNVADTAPLFRRRAV